MKTVVLGAEHDQPLRKALGAAVRTLGAERREHEWGVGGSQEVESWVAEIDGHVVRVEAETYTGLSITGPDDLVDRICALVRG